MTPTMPQVREAYHKADASAKQILESLFGDDLADITERIKTVKDAFSAVGLAYDAIAPGDYEDLRRGILAFHKLCVIAEALNEGWKPDWSNSSQEKWYPWFGFRGGRFVFYDVNYLCTSSLLGSRLCFRSAELAKYAGETFLDLYNEFLSVG